MRKLIEQSKMEALNETALESLKFHLKNIFTMNDELKYCDSHLKNLHHWDKNNSHKQAILKALDKRKELKNSFSVLLKGFTFEEWKKMSARTSVLKGKIKKLKSEELKQKAITELNELTNKFLSVN